MRRVQIDLSTATCFFSWVVCCFSRSATAHVNGWVDDDSTPKHKPTGVSRRCFFDTLLKDSDDTSMRSNTTTTHTTTTHTTTTTPTSRPAVKTAVVKPNNYISQSFGDFRVTNDNTQHAVANKAENNNALRPAPSTPKKMHRVASSLDKAHPRAALNTENERSRLRRVKSAENRLTTADERVKSAGNRLTTADERVRRSQSPVSWSSSLRTSSRASTVASTVGSAGSCYVSALMLKAAPDKDRLYSKLLHIGDRVYVDMARGRGQRFCIVINGRNTQRLLVTSQQPRHVNTSSISVIIDFSFDVFAEEKTLRSTLVY